MYQKEVLTARNKVSITYIVKWCSSLQGAQRVRGLNAPLSLLGSDNEVTLVVWCHFASGNWMRLDLLLPEERC
jgi:hypothetical protein